MLKAKNKTPAKQEQPAGAKRKLSRAEKKQIAAIIQKAKGDGKAHTAQQSIPYVQMLKRQLSKGNNGLVKTKYITFAVEADNLKAAKARLARIETDILNHFKVLGVSAHALTGFDRLQTMHGIFHPEGEPFSFSWDWLTPSGLSTKDFIAPSSFHFGEGRSFRMGRKVGAVSFLQILAPEQSKAQVRQRDMEL